MTLAPTARPMMKRLEARREAEMTHVSRRMRRHATIACTVLLSSFASLGLPSPATAHGMLLESKPHARETVEGVGDLVLRFKLDAARDALDGAPDAHSVFISIHFDHAPPGFAGAKIYTVPQLASHPFVTILSETLTTHGLGYRNHGRQLPNVDTSQKFIVLAEGRVEPRVLIELGNFVDADDRARMLSPSGRQRYADVVVEALSEYLSVENR